MIFECICKRCFAEYQVDRSDLMKGSTWWTLCPACRQIDTAELPITSHPSDFAEPLAATTADGKEGG